MFHLVSLMNVIFLLEDFYVVFNDLKVMFRAALSSILDPLHMNICIYEQKDTLLCSVICKQNLLTSNPTNRILLKAAQPKENVHYIIK